MSDIEKLTEDDLKDTPRKALVKAVIEMDATLANGVTVEIKVKPEEKA